MVFLFTTTFSNKQFTNANKFGKNRMESRHTGYCSIAKHTIMPQFNPTYMNICNIYTQSFQCSVDGNRIFNHRKIERSISLLNWLWFIFRNSTPLGIRIVRLVMSVNYWNSLLARLLGFDFFFLLFFNLNIFLFDLKRTHTIQNI